MLKNVFHFISTYQAFIRSQNTNVFYKQKQIFFILCFQKRITNTVDVTYIQGSGVKLRDGTLLHSVTLARRVTLHQDFFSRNETCFFFLFIIFKVNAFLLLLILIISLFTNFFFLYYNCYPITFFFGRYCFYQFFLLSYPQPLHFVGIKKKIF